jgi:TRAP-type mannitol/chloroaromatic compound transport system permease small subunit
MDISNATGRLSSRLCVLLAMTLLASVAVAQTYSVKLTSSLHDLDIKIEPVETTGMLVIKLTNKTDGKVRCDLRYDAAPQTPYRTTTYVDPGKTEQSTFLAKRTWFSVDVTVECRPVKAQ